VKRPQLRFSSHIYGGRNFRPTPAVEFDAEQGYLFVCTPWGPSEGAAGVIASTRDQFLSMQTDREVTSPFDRLSCLSSVANDLRTSIKLANDKVYHEDNRNEHLVGFEFFAMVTAGDEFCFAQLGAPTVLLSQGPRGLFPLSSGRDLATEFSTDRDPLTPLPAHLLGVDPTTDFETQSVRKNTQQKYLFLSRSQIPAEVLALPADRLSVETVVKLCAQRDPETPFWVGLLEVV
jgi:hypothetical protein